LFDDVDGAIAAWMARCISCRLAFTLQYVFGSGIPIGPSIHVHTGAAGARARLGKCLIRMAEESPAGMPVWPLQGKRDRGNDRVSLGCGNCRSLREGFKQIDFREPIR